MGEVTDTSYYDYGDYSGGGDYVDNGDYGDYGYESRQVPPQTQSQFQQQPLYCNKLCTAPSAAATADAGVLRQLRAAASSATAATTAAGVLLELRPAAASTTGAAASPVDLRVQPTAAATATPAALTTAASFRPYPALVSLTFSRTISASPARTASPNGPIDATVRD